MCIYIYNTYVCIYIYNYIYIYVFIVVYLRRHVFTDMSCVQHVHPFGMNTFSSENWFVSSSSINILCQEHSLCKYPTAKRKTVTPSKICWFCLLEVWMRLTNYITHHLQNLHQTVARKSSNLWPFTIFTELYHGNLRHCFPYVFPIQTAC